MIVVLFAFIVGGCLGFFAASLCAARRIEDAEWDAARSRQRWAELAEVMSDRTDQHKEGR